MRYYGLYARHREANSKLHKAIHKSKHQILLDFNTWRKSFLLTMGYDPLQCFFYIIMTTGLAGGLLCPYKGLIPACAWKAH